MVGLIIGVHAGTVMEGTVREGIIRLMGTRGVVAVATGPKNKMKEKNSKHQCKQCLPFTQTTRMEIFGINTK